MTDLIKQMALTSSRIYLALVLFCPFPQCGGYAQEAQGGANEAAAEQAPLLQGYDFEVVSSVGYLVDELGKLNARSVNCVYKDNAIQFWNGDSMLEISESASQAVEIGSQVFRTDQIVALFDMLNSLFATESEKSDCLFASYNQWQSLSYKKMTRLEIHFESSVIGLDAWGNEPIYDQLYSLRVGDASEFMFGALLKQGDIGFETQEKYRLLSMGK